MAKPLSAKIVIKILCKEFGFYIVSQKGSHMKLYKKLNNREIITIVPMHKELAHGTLKGILGLAEISEEDFRSKLQKHKNFPVDDERAKNFLFPTSPEIFCPRAVAFGRFRHRTAGVVR